jgi:hypothetical protein
MAEDVRRIVAEFAARNKSMGEIAAFTRGLDKTLTSVRRLAAGLLTAAGVSGIGYMIKQQMEVIDSTAKLSDRLGVTTESLIALQYAGKITGIEQETLNSSIEVFNRKLGEASLGAKETRKSIESLGLNYKDLAGIPVDEAIGKVADKINMLGTQSKKAAILQDLFGKSSKELMNLFAEGSSGLANYRKETDKLGLSFSRIDAAKVEAANDALTRTKAVFTGIFRTGTIELAPFIEAAAKSLNNFATQGQGIGVNVTNAMESVTLSLVEVASAAEHVMRILKGSNDWPWEIAAKHNEAIDKARQSYKALTGDIEAFKITASDINYIAGTYSQELKEPRDPKLFSSILKEEKIKLGLESEDYKNKVRQVFEDIRKNAEYNAAGISGKNIIIPSASGLGLSLPKELFEKPNTEGITAFAGMTDKQMKKAVESTRDAMQQMRSMDYLTRNERIMNLEAYKAAHADVMIDVVGKETEAGKLINQEIENLKRSRLDAMKVYATELKNDMEDLALYTSEKFAESARSIEGSMSSAFDSMITKGASFKEASEQFLLDIAGSFSKMASDMAARGIMKISFDIIGIEASSITASTAMATAITAAGTTAAAAMGTAITASGSIAASEIAAAMAIGGAVGSAKGNIFSSGHIIPFGRGDIIDRPSMFPMANGTGLMGEAGPEAVMPLKRGPGGRLGVESSSPNINFQPQMKVVIVRNEREAQIEAMNSPEGTKTIISTVAKNRRMLG